MRKFIFSVVIVAFTLGFFACNNNTKTANNDFTINFNLKNAKQDLTLIMQQRRNGSWIKDDSTVLKNGKGSFSGHINLPEIYYFIIKGKQGYMPIWIDKGTINVETDIQHLRSPKITGSQAQDIFIAYKDSIKRFDRQQQTMGQDYNLARKSGDTTKMKKIEESYNELQKGKTNYILNYGMHHNKEVVAAYIIMNNSYSLALNQLDSVVSNFDSSIADSYYVKHLKDRVNTLKKVAVGQHFVDFTLKDPNGKPVSLSSVVKNNKYVLVDFWASWCMPCRAENPNVVKAYKKYHDKGFTVFGVSLDKDHAKWVDAIKKDGLTWQHVSDLKYWSSKAGKLYGIQSIPHNVLIGPNGIIIAKNLRGQALQDKLQELLGK